MKSTLREARSCIHQPFLNPLETFHAISGRIGELARGMGYVGVLLVTQGKSYKTQTKSMIKVAETCEVPKLTCMVCTGYVGNSPQLKFMKKIVCFAVIPVIPYDPAKALSTKGMETTQDSYSMSIFRSQLNSKTGITSDLDIFPLAYIPPTPYSCVKRGHNSLGQ